ncbi:MAG: hypothetical protein DRG24_04850 [Epsilonproteobacteria bacterium]|nr:MAG: hypothetical protein DRG24_04850 [Campylobacterota bacterium]
MKQIAFILLLGFTILNAATIKTKALACEHDYDLNMGYELWETKDQNFLYFIFKNHCQILRVGAKIDVLKEKDAFALLNKEVSLVRWINGRELWIRRTVIQK